MPYVICRCGRYISLSDLSSLHLYRYCSDTEYSEVNRGENIVRLLRQASQAAAPRTFGEHEDADEYPDEQFAEIFVGVRVLELTHEFVVCPECGRLLFLGEDGSLKGIYRPDDAPPQ